ncbi:hypothetical protein QQE94_03535 [Fervidobacterium pennivorans subsp. shakshaketiis]|uniref:hypothetical protein n=1 Tax=Fervidobacterium TaxID=2422 RepID=UPI0014367205|nr:MULTISPECIES: hypothetical protein [Fervidobacterium]QIV78226.1 hypothetical protein HER11_04085 [Fervidobacterium pennivorans subsp. keratinolyticus]
MASFETSTIQFFLRSFRFKYIIEKRIADGSLKREPAKPMKKLFRKFSIEEFTLLGRLCMGSYTEDFRTTYCGSFFAWWSVCWQYN